MSGPDDWIDVSVPIAEGMLHWPGNPPVSLRRVLAIEHGDGANVSALSLGVHTGTHVDAPLHFLSGGQDVAGLDPGASIGPVRVVEIDSGVSVGRGDLEPAEPRPGERLLFKTRNSDRGWWQEPFREDFVFVSAGAAEYLADCGVALVGVDYLSVGGFATDGEATHRALLTAGILILEGLDLSSVSAGVYELVCLPLRLAGSDGAPARALLRPIGASAT
jgi:arylformamidase